MTLTESPYTGEILLSTDDPRAIGLAKTLCLRRARRVPTRFYMGHADAARFTALFDAGFEACPRWVGGDMQRRYRQPGGEVLRLHEALAIARFPLASVSGSGKDLTTPSLP